MTCRVVVLISGQGTILSAILSAIRSRPIPAQVCAVFSNKAEAFGLTYAAAENIPTHVLIPQQYSDRDSYDAALMQAIDEYAPELVVLAGFLRVLTPAFTQHYLGRLINIHPSLLPAYPGMHTYERALAAGEKMHGTTVHFVNDVLDGGPIIAQARVPVLPDDTVDALSQRVKAVECELYPTIIDWFARGQLKLENGSAVLNGERL